MAPLHFYEKQKFRQWWVWLVLLLALGIPLGFAFEQIFNQNQPDFSSEDLIGIFSGSIIAILLMILFFAANLEVEIDDYLVSYKFFPFHFSTKKIYWEDIDRAYVSKYNAIGDYGGWGIRNSLRNGKAFNVSGNIGLQLYLKNGRKILLGTKKQIELEELMKHLYAKSVVKESVKFQLT